MKLPGFVSRAMSLREAAAVIFVLVALLPLLLFVAVISASGLISRTEAQFAAFMALIIACLGFVVFRRMVDQIARLAVKVQIPPGETSAVSVGEPPRVPGLGHVSEIGQGGCLPADARRSPGLHPAAPDPPVSAGLRQRVG